MIRNLLIDHLKKHNLKSFIDVGCGEGVTAGEIKKALPSLYVKGIDIAKGYIEKAKKDYPDVKYQVMDVRSLRFKPKTFDLAHTNGVLIHVPHKDIEKVIKGILWMAREAVFLESQGKEVDELQLNYDPVEYWNQRPGKEKPDYIEQNTKYYFSHPYEKLFEKLKLDFKVEKDFKDKNKTRVYRIWQSR